MIAQRERERKEDIEKRKRFLLSIQQPFKFQEREKDKTEQLLSLNQVSHDHVHKTGNSTKSLKEVKNSSSEVKGEFFLFAGILSRE